jgi:hypothetical protein
MNTKTGANPGFEDNPWNAADKLRSAMAVVET